MRISDTIAAMIATKVAAMITPVLTDTVTTALAPTERQTPVPIIRPAGGRGQTYVHQKKQGRHLAKVTPDDVRAIRAALAGVAAGRERGFVVRSLCAEYGLSRQSVENIAHRITWKEVD